MKKKFLYMFFTFFFCFIFVNPVYADPENEANCGDMAKLIEDYDFYSDLIKGIDCTDTSDEETVITCNDNKLRINITVSEIMKYNDMFNVCDSQKADVNRIISENEDRCSQIFDDDFTNFVNGVMIVFYIVAPILLILFGSLDYAKAVVASEAEALKKANQRFLKRLAATILIFLAPVITNLIISFNISDYYLSGNSYACDFNYTVFNKKWNIKYVPKQTNTSSNTTTAGQTHYDNMVYKGGKLPIPFPVDDISLTSFFGYRIDPIRGGQVGENHGGVDLISTNRSIDILAVADGTVTRVTGGCVAGNKSCGNGYGNRVQIMHNINGQQIETLYAHMASTPLVSEGQVVTAGTKIGNMGTTGSSTGNHLHFEVRINGVKQNPLDYICDDPNKALYQKW